MGWQGSGRIWRAEGEKEADRKRVAELKKVIARLKELQEQIQGHGDVLGISDQEREELMEQLSGFYGGFADEGWEKYEAITASGSDAVGDALGDLARRGDRDRRKRAFQADRGPGGPGGSG